MNSVCLILIHLFCQLLTDVDSKARRRSVMLSGKGEKNSPVAKADEGRAKLGACKQWRGYSGATVIRASDSSSDSTENSKDQFYEQ